MELIVLGSLAFIGNEISKFSPKQSRRPHKQVSLLKDNINDISQQSDFNPKPFFTSAKSQNTNDNVKQRRIETFTGCDDTSFQHKKECSNMFQPTSNLSHINGSPAIMDDFRENRYTLTVTDKMHNTLPFEQQRIGPGLNTDDPSKGGFHERYRILPTNVGDYKKNNFAGRINTGKNLNSNRENLPNLCSNSQQLYYTTDDRPLVPSRSDISAPGSRPAFDLNHTQREQCSSLIGIAAPANQSESHMNNPDTTRNNDRTQCIHHGNPASLVPNTGAYNISGHIINEGQREQCNNNIINANHQTSGQQMQSFTNTLNTQREQEQHLSGHAHLPQASSSTSGFYSLPTQRQSSHTPYNGAPSQQHSGLHINNFSSNPTQRQTTHSNYTGNAGSIHKAAMSEFNVVNNSSPYYLREQQSRCHTPGAGNMNLLNDPNKRIPHMLVNNDCTTNNHIPHINGPKSVSNSKALGCIEFTPKINNINPHINDLNLAMSQLSNNSINHDINNNNTNNNGIVNLPITNTSPNNCQ